MGTNDKRSGSARMCLLDACSCKQLSNISGVSVPNGLEQRRFYEPTERGLEAKIRARLAELNERDAAARGKK